MVWSVDGADTLRPGALCVDRSCVGGDFLRQLTTSEKGGQSQQQLTFKRRIKSRLPFAGIIRSSLYSPRFQDKG